MISKTTTKKMQPVFLILCITIILIFCCMFFAINIEPIAAKANPVAMYISASDFSDTGISYDTGENGYITYTLDTSNITSPVMVITMPKDVTVNSYPLSNDATLSIYFRDDKVTYETDENGNTIITYYFISDAQISFSINIIPTMQLCDGETIIVEAEFFNGAESICDADQNITVSNITLKAGAITNVGFNYDSTKTEFTVMGNAQYYYSSYNPSIHTDFSSGYGHYKWNKLELYIPILNECVPGIGTTDDTFSAFNEYDEENNDTIYDISTLYMQASLKYLKNVTVGSSTSNILIITYDNCESYYNYQFFNGTYSSLCINETTLSLRFDVPEASLPVTYTYLYTPKIVIYYNDVNDIETGIISDDYSELIDSNLYVKFKEFNLTEHLYINSNSLIIKNQKYLNNDILNIKDNSYLSAEIYNDIDGLTDVKLHYTFDAALYAYKFKFKMNYNNLYPQFADEIYLEYKTAKGEDTVFYATISANYYDMYYALDDQTDAIVDLYVTYNRLNNFESTSSDEVMRLFMYNGEELDSEVPVTAQIISGNISVNYVESGEIGIQPEITRDLSLLTSYNSITNRTIIDNTILSKGSTFSLYMYNYFGWSNYNQDQIYDCFCELVDPEYYILVPKACIYTGFKMPLLWDEYSYTVTQTAINVDQSNAGTYGISVGEYTFIKLAFTGDYIGGFGISHCPKVNFIVGPTLNTTDILTLKIFTGYQSSSTRFTFTTNNRTGLDPFDLNGDSLTTDRISCTLLTATVSAASAFTIQPFITTSLSEAGEYQTASYQYNSTGNYELYVYNGSPSVITDITADITVAKKNVSVTKDGIVSTSQWNVNLTSIPVITGESLEYTIFYSLNNGTYYSSDVPANWNLVTNVRIIFSTVTFLTTKYILITLPFEVDFDSATIATSYAYFGSSLEYTSTSTYTITSPTVVLKPEAIEISGLIYKDYDADNSIDTFEEIVNNSYSVKLYNGDMTTGVLVSNVETNYFTGKYKLLTFLPGSYNVYVTKLNAEYFPSAASTTYFKTVDGNFASYLVSVGTDTLLNIDLGILVPRTIITDQTSYAVEEGSTTKVTATVNGLGEGESVTFESSDDAYATVDNTGFITYVNTSTDGSLYVTIRVPQLPALLALDNSLDAYVTTNVTVYAENNACTEAASPYFAESIDGSAVTSLETLASSTGCTKYIYYYFNHEGYCNLDHNQVMTAYFTFNYTTASVSFSTVSQGDYIRFAITAAGQGYVSINVMENWQHTTSAPSPCGFTLTYNPPTATVGNVTVSGTENTVIDQIFFEVTLNGDTFKSSISSGTDISSWFGTAGSDYPSGLSMSVLSYVSIGSSSILINISGTPLDVFSGEMNITIPASYLNSNSPLSVTTNSNAKFDISVEYFEVNVIARYSSFMDGNFTEYASGTAGGSVYISESSTIGTLTSISVASGSTVYLKAEPAALYMLHEWCVEGDNYPTSLLEHNIIVNNDITFYAMFRHMTRIVVFDNGSHGIQPSNQEVLIGNYATEPALTATGYIIDNWYTSIDSDIPFNIESTAIVNDIILYAKWLPVTHFSAIAANCIAIGNIEYWYCPGNNKYYSDENYSIEITSFMTPVLGHDYTVFVRTVAPTDAEQGYDVYKCSRCDSTHNTNFTVKEVISEISETDNAVQEGSVVSNSGFAINEKVLITAIENTEADFALNLGNNEIISDIYNVSLYINDVKQDSVAGSYTIKIKSNENQADGSDVKVLVYENNAVVEKTATISNGYITFTTNTLGNFALISTKPTVFTYTKPAEPLNKGVVWWEILLIVISAIIFVLIILFLFLYISWKKKGYTFGILAIFVPVYRLINNIIFKTKLNDIEKKEEMKN